MDYFWFYVVCAAAGLAITWQIYRIVARRFLPRALQQAIEQLSLVKEGSDFAGSCDGARVTLRDTGRDYDLVEVRGPAPTLDLGLTLAAGAGSVLTGDPVFDAEVRARGLDELELLALVDPETRKKLLEAVRAGAWLEKAGWCARFTGPWLTSEALVRVAQAIGAAHAALERASRRSLRDALRARLQDPGAGVRKRALGLLVERGWAEPALLAPLLKDLDPEVRLVAATGSGQWEVLLQMVAKASRTWRMRASQALLEHDAPLDEGGRAIIEDAALDLLGDEELSEVAVGLLGAVGRPTALTALSELARTGGPALRAAAETARSAITARHGLQAGGLAIVADQAGRVSEPTPDS
jgi:hypothetical protein